MRGVNDDEICDFVELTRSLPLDVRFIEYMPFDANAWSDNKFVSYRDMVQRITARCPMHQGLLIDGGGVWGAPCMRGEPMRFAACRFTACACLPGTHPLTAWWTASTTRPRAMVSRGSWAGCVG